MKGNQTMNKHAVIQLEASGRDCSWHGRSSSRHSSERRTAAKEAAGSPVYQDPPDQ